MGWQSFTAAGTPYSVQASLGYPDLCEGRLTTESGVPVSTSDRTSQGTIYFTPSTTSGVATTLGWIALYNGSALVAVSFAQLSLALTVTSGKNYDVFVDYNGGALQLVLSAAWTDDSTRADALGVQSGIVIKSGTAAYRWVGTIRASGSNVTADSGGGVTTQVGGQRFVWNAYNQVERQLAVIDTTDNWAYTTNTIRQANGASGNQVEYVAGAVSTLLTVNVNGIVYIQANVGVAAKVGVGIDSTTTFASGTVQGGYNQAATAVYAPVQASYRGYPGLGYHVISWNEKGADVTCLFLGDNAGDGQQAGLLAVLLG